MSDLIAVPEVKVPLTMDIINSWSPEEMRKKLADSASSAEIDAVIAAFNSGVVSEPVDEALVAQVAAEKEAADKAAAEKAAADQAAAEKAAADAAAAKVLADKLAADAAAAAVPTKKFVIDFQATDESGNPIGRRTHLEASSQDELDKKLLTSYENAVRYAERLKRQKLTYNPPEPTKKELTEDEIVEAVNALRKEDPAKAIAAIRKLANIDDIEKERDAARKAIQTANSMTESNKFLRNHLGDYNNCEANAAIMKQYIQDNNLEWTADNMELALLATQDQLAPVVSQAPIVPVPVPVPVPAPVVAAANPPAPVVPPVVSPVEVPKVPTAQEVLDLLLKANPGLLDTRPGFNGGLQPGGQSGVRPVAQATRLTWEEIFKWDGPTMRAEMRKSQARLNEISEVIAEHQASLTAHS
jgi:hypothetical protein